MKAPLIGQLEQPVLVALRELRAAYPETQISLIGARALAFHVSMTWRHTADIDIVLTIALDDLKAAEKKLVGWRRLHPPKWIAHNGVHVDIVPAPADALAKRELVWPDGATMNLAGIAVALENRAHLLSEELNISVAPVALIALLKMAAYLDRPIEREKDLRDLANILNEYPPNDDDKLFEDEFYAAGLTEEQRRGAILARELVELIGDQDRAVVTEFITKMDRNGADWSRFVSASPWKNDEDRLEEHFDAFCERFRAALVPVVSASAPAIPTASSLRVRFVVNGEEVVIETSADAPLSVAVAAALSKTHNTGRPPAEWDLRRENGVVVPQSQTPAECGLADGATLFLSLRAGAGGDAPRN